MTATTLRATGPTAPAIGFILPSHESAATVGKGIKSVALFFAAPFIGLVYAMALPHVALLVVAPFIGLVYAVLLPFVGIAMIARTGYDAYRA